jgi:hypothetical protein
MGRPDNSKQKGVNVSSIHPEKVRKATKPIRITFNMVFEPNISEIQL